MCVLRSKLIYSTHLAFTVSKGIHPQKVTRKVNNTEVPLDIFEYLFVHAQRLPEKNMLRPINKHRYSTKSRNDRGETIRERRTSELEGEEENNRMNDDRHKRKLYQRALGLFNRVEVTQEQVTCTCENFHRFGRCEDSELIGFICLGELGYPSTEEVVDFNEVKEGYSVVSDRLRNKVMNLVDVDKISVSPPPKDPSRILQQPE